MDTFHPGCCVSNKGFYYVSQAGAGGVYCCWWKIVDYTLAMQEIIVFLCVFDGGRSSPCWNFRSIFRVSTFSPDSSSHKGCHVGCDGWVPRLGDLPGCHEWLRAISLEKQKAIYAIWGPCWPNFDSRRPSQGCSAVYLLFAVWLSMHASVASHSYLADG